MSGKAIIISAPSGSGKTTLVRHLLASRSNLEFSISATTRSKRNKQEEEGSHYYFFTRETFKDKIDRGDFMEWQEVYPGKFYGTLRSEIQRIWNNRKNVIFDIDVQGGLNLKKIFERKSLSIFVKVSSESILKQRLIQRNTEIKRDIYERLSKTRKEMTFESQFDKVLINDDIEQSKRELIQLYDHFTR